jgi:hypothetical protein
MSQPPPLQPPPLQPPPLQPPPLQTSLRELLTIVVKDTCNKRRRPSPHLSLGYICSIDFLRVLKLESRSDDPIRMQLTQSLLLVVILADNHDLQKQKEPFVELLETYGLNRDLHSCEQLELFVNKFAAEPNSAIFHHLVLYAKEHVKSRGTTGRISAKTDAYLNVIGTFMLRYWHTFFPSHYNVNAPVTTLEQICILISGVTMRPEYIPLCKAFPDVFVYMRGVLKEKLLLYLTEEEKKEEKEEVESWLDVISDICDKLEK